MTASNHAVTGALIAVIFPKPYIAIPLAFAAHFVMDALPHFGVAEKDINKRNKNQIFLLTLMIDIMIAGLLLISLPLVLNQAINPWLLFLSMLACMSPDLVWGRRFYHEVRHKTTKQLSNFSLFHTNIQWSETPKGLIIEILWFIVVFNLVFLPL